MTELRQVARACCVQGTHCACMHAHFHPHLIVSSHNPLTCVLVLHTDLEAGLRYCNTLEAGARAGGAAILWRRGSSNTLEALGLYRSAVLCSTRAQQLQPQVTSRVLHAVAGSGNETRAQTGIPPPSPPGNSTYQWQ